MEPPAPVVDLVLSRRLELTEGHANAAMVASRARLEPSRGACAARFAGAYALFDGVGSPLTQSFGLGVEGAPSPQDLDALDEFFRSRSATPHHEVSPLADTSLLPLLVSRGHAPVELTTVLFQRLSPRRGSSSLVPVRLVERSDDAEADAWAAVSAAGWSSEGDAIAAFARGVGRVNARAESSFCFLAELEGRAVGSAAMHLHEGVALLAGASTVPAARRRGVQAALLDARLRFAADAGCDLAMMGAAPGSASQRNAERQGFRIAYTRIKWGPRPA